MVNQTIEHQLNHRSIRKFNVIQAEVAHPL